MAEGHILFTGLLRMPKMLEATLRLYSRFQAEGRIGRIVFSTWEAEARQRADLIAHLRALNPSVEVVAGPEPGVSVAPYYGNPFHQLLTLDNGLRLFDDGDWVLRTRTDVHLAPSLLDTVLTHTRALAARGRKTLPSPFLDRIWAPWLEVTTPFYIGDETFFGSVRDLRRLVDYDAEMLVKCGDMAFNVHQTFFYRPFRHALPFFSHLFQAQRPENLRLDREDGRRFHALNAALSTEGYWRYLLAYYQVVEENFFIYSEPYDHGIHFIPRNLADWDEHWHSLLANMHYNPRLQAPFRSLLHMLRPENAGIRGLFIMRNFAHLQATVAGMATLGYGPFDRARAALGPRDLADDGRWHHDTAALMAAVAAAVGDGASSMPPELLLQKDLAP